LYPQIFRDSSCFGWLDSDVWASSNLLLQLASACTGGELEQARFLDFAHSWGPLAFTSTAAYNRVILPVLKSKKDILNDFIFETDKSKSFDEYLTPNHSHSFSGIVEAIALDKTTKLKLYNAWDHGYTTMWDCKCQQLLYQLDQIKQQQQKQQQQVQIEQQPHEDSVPLCGYCRMSYVASSGAVQLFDEKNSSVSFCNFQCGKTEQLRFSSTSATRGKRNRDYETVVNKLFSGSDVTVLSTYIAGQRIVMPSEEVYFIT
jgi:hypothetical protein